MHAIIVFSSAQTAGHIVAGLPAAARAVREAALAGVERCALLVGGGWSPVALVCGELERLGAPMRLALVASTEDIPDIADIAEHPALVIAGEALVPAQAIRRAQDGTEVPGVGLWRGDSPSPAPAPPDAGLLARLDRAGRAIVAATAKPGDGIVSRSINRPVSQAVSRLLLRFPRVRPGHATLGTALLAIAMLACLLGLPGYPGLAWGALLFQAASIFDGVDGEIARATFRASPRGAMFDSLVDAATNLGFVAGVVVNLHRQGESRIALLGAGGLALLATGTLLLGLRARRRQAFTFDEVKDHFGKHRSRVMTVLTWLTMRDFYALAAAVLLAAGMAKLAVSAFAVIAAGWFAVVFLTIVRHRA